MTETAWLRTFSLFLWIYNAAASALLLAYFYGICRLAERRFGGRTYAFLLPVFLALMFVSTLFFSLSDSLAALSLWHAVWPALASILLAVVVYRSYRLMMGR